MVVGEVVAGLTVIAETLSGICFYFGRCACVWETGEFCSPMSVLNLVLHWIGIVV